MFKLVSSAGLVSSPKRGLWAEEEIPRRGRAGQGGRNIETLENTMKSNCVEVKVSRHQDGPTDILSVIRYTRKIAALRAAFF